MIERLRRPAYAALAGLLALLSLSVPLAAQQESGSLQIQQEEHTASVQVRNEAVEAALAQQEEPPSSELAFMTGCWAEPGDGLREQFTEPADNMILGTSRYVIERRVQQFEFHRIDIGENASSLTPHPGGQGSVAFTSVRNQDNYVVWQNLEHDFPQRIIYDGREEGFLLVAIEGERDGETARREWRMRSVPCRP